MTARVRDRREGAGRDARTLRTCPANRCSAGLGASLVLPVILAARYLTFIPFGGTMPAVNSLLGEHIDAAMVDYPAAAGQLKGGKLRG